MVTLNFGTFSKTTVQNRLTPVPKARLDVINPMAEKQKVKGLIPTTIKFGEIMWVHSDIIEDEQWESNKPKLKSKSCNTISLATDDDAMTVGSLSAQKKRNLP